jgi:hypothetical protein
MIRVAVTGCLAILVAVSMGLFWSLPAFVAGGGGTSLVKACLHLIGWDVVGIFLVTLASGFLTLAIGLPETSIEPPPAGRTWRSRSSDVREDAPLAETR